LLAEEERAERVARIVQTLDWKSPWFAVAAIGKEGTWAVAQQVMSYLDALREAEAEAKSAAMAAVPVVAVVHVSVEEPNNVDASITSESGNV